eukprot:scaffold115320_cov18-Tisochrysis_lutea.AAC.1
MEHTADGFWQTVIESHDAAKSAHRVMEFAKAILDFSGQSKIGVHRWSGSKLKLGNCSDLFLMSGMLGMGSVCIP